jgi:very-short-patch-repair endonuclease
MDTELDRRLYEIARAQFGLIHRRQAQESGATRPQLRHRVDSGEWERLAGGVLRRTGSPCVGSPDRAGGRARHRRGRGPGGVQRRSRVCDELSEHGRDGMKVMREVLVDRPIGYVPPESNLEARVQQLAVDHGLPEMRRQVELGGREWLGRVDFVAVDLPLVVFVDGERWHSSVLDRAADAKQQTGLEAAGFVVVRVLEHEVWYDHPAIVRRIREGANKARRVRYERRSGHTRGSVA